VRLITFEQGSAHNTGDDLLILKTFFENEFLAHKPDTSDRTVKLYDYTIRKFGSWLGRDPTIDDLTNANVGSYLRHLKSLDMAVNSVDKERRQLLSIWRFAHTLGMLQKGPVIGPMKIPASVPKSLTVAELKRLNNAFDLLRGKTAGIQNGPFLRALMGVQYATAARVGAVLQLRFDDISGDVITFRAETRKGGRKPIVKAVTEEVLKNIHAISLPKRELIFPLKATNKTKIQTLYSRLFKAAKVARPKGKSSHLMRSTHATLLELAGGDATKSLGHANRETTIKSYLDPRHDADRSCDMLPEIE